MIRRSVPVLVGLAMAVIACSAKNPEVALYCALDQEHSEALVDLFRKETGIPVRATFDTEASKTVGLVSAITEEAAHPRCDVFWNNELVQTVGLAQKGLLQPYSSPSAVGIPAIYKDAGGLWTGFAARARVIIVNTAELGTDRAAWPKSLQDFADPKWKGKCAIAKPLTGTTLSHFAALRDVMGKDKFNAWLDALDKNDVKWLSSNGSTMKAAVEQNDDVVFALTDTDDFHVALSKGQPVAAVFPDQEEGGLGTMLIPNSIALVKGAPHAEIAKKFIDFVLSERVEGLLAAAKSAQIPLREGVKGPPADQILGLGKFRQMVWDPARVAASLGECNREFGERFLSR